MTLHPNLVKLRRHRAISQGANGCGQALGFHVGQHRQQVWHRQEQDLHGGRPVRPLCALLVADPSPRDMHGFARGFALEAGDRPDIRTHLSKRGLFGAMPPRPPRPPGRSQRDGELRRARVPLRVGVGNRKALFFGRGDDNPHPHTERGRGGGLLFQWSIHWHLCVTVDRKVPMVL